MDNGKLQTKLSEAISAVIADWANDDPEEPMPLDVVLAALDDSKKDAPKILEDVKSAHEDWLSSQEGPSFDDALAMKCDARAREDAARLLK